ncbi:hypothetical protein LMH81_31720, partial [Vibrio lentus]|uniref:hypothetical protein n=1 Tax=Vibrio lentus TaxID=136468 RepID=UPI001E56C3B5
WGISESGLSVGLASFILVFMASHGRELRGSPLARSSRSSFAKQKCDGSATGCYTVSLFGETVFGGLPPSLFY